MKKLLTIALAAATLLFSCNKPSGNGNGPGGNSNAPVFAKGADISWVTEYESKKFKFFASNGAERECTALMKDLGCNAVRYRVWVDPSDGWCNKADVLVKAKRAQALGMAIMIDFHYSDSWADPGKQNTPAAWKGMNVTQMASALADHTKDVLKTLKDNNIDVTWVQVGNETNTGMCWDTGKVSNGGAFNFATLANAGYDAVKSVYPDALVIIHHSNAQSLGENQWFFNLIDAAGCKFDMMGFSLYPSYWDDSIKGYPDWTPYCSSALSTFQTMHTSYDKPVMLVEFGMPASEPAKAKAAMQYLLDGVKTCDWFKGIFYWEPESEQSRNGYAYGAFSGGSSTGVIDLFKTYDR